MCARRSLDGPTNQRPRSARVGSGLDNGARRARAGFAPVNIDAEFAQEITLPSGFSRWSRPDRKIGSPLALDFTPRSLLSRRTGGEEETTTSDVSELVQITPNRVVDGGFLVFWVSRSGRLVFVLERREGRARD